VSVDPRCRDQHASRISIKDQSSQGIKFQKFSDFLSRVLDFAWEEVPLKRGIALVCFDFRLGFVTS
jgi:hypothetical protein